MVKLFVEPITPIFACCDRWIVAEDVASASRFQSESRRAEHLSWRRIVRRELGRDVVIGYNDVGAPIVDTPDMHISVAHAKRGMVAVAIADRRVGVDIESVERDFEHVASRYMSDGERALCADADWYAMVWCAKEAMYKLYGRRGAELCGDMGIDGYDASTHRACGFVGDSRVVIDIDMVEDGYVVAVATYK